MGIHFNSFNGKITANFVECELQMLTRLMAVQLGTCDIVFDANRDLLLTDEKCRGVNTLLTCRNVRARDRFNFDYGVLLCSKHISETLGYFFNINFIYT